MRPRDAASIFNELEQPVLIQVLDRMKGGEGGAGARRDAAGTGPGGDDGAGEVANPRTGGGATLSRFWGNLAWAAAVALLGPVGAYAAPLAVNQRRW